MENPGISIVIRCLNEEAHIKRLLEGILAQNRKDFEIVIVDSGSTDKTLSIARGYPVNIVHIQPERFSFGYSLNVGLSHSKGEFVVIVSAHCYPTNTMWLTNLVRMFDNPEIGLVYGRQVGNSTTKYFEKRIFRKLFPETSIHVKDRDPFCNNANAAIRRSIWEDIPYDEDLTGLEDLDWAVKILAKGRCIGYSAEAEVAHVHDETDVQRYNRYKREAIALKRIFPHSHFNWWDFITLYSSNCIQDLVAARSEGILREKAVEILKCRWHQFAGTYSGYRFSGSIEKDMRMRFFYPEGWRKSRSNVEIDSKVGPAIEKGSQHKPRIVALVPMRADSKRVPNKNIRLFHGKPLYFYILTTLLNCPEIEEVFVNTNSEILMDEIPRKFDRVRIIERPERLCGDMTPMNDILLHDINFVAADLYLQTHSTNPLLGAHTITRAIRALLRSPDHDSLFSVTPMFTRLWDIKGRPVNHNPDVLMRTQDLDPIFEENSNIYIFTGQTLRSNGNRIGANPMMFEIPREEAWDIDEEIDFRIAEFLYAKGMKAVESTVINARPDRASDKQSRAGSEK